MLKGIDQGDFAIYVLSQSKSLLRSVSPEQLIDLYRWDLDRRLNDIEDSLEEIEEINNEAMLSSELGIAGITLNPDYNYDLRFRNRSNLN